MQITKKILSTTRSKYQQPVANAAKLFWCKEWQRKENNGKAEWINNMEKEVQGLEDGPDELGFAQSNTEKGIELENARP